MSENVYRVKNKNSSVLIDGQPKLPTAEQMEYGEIAINYAAGHETISIKNSDDEIVAFPFTESFEVIARSLNDLNVRVTEISASTSSIEELDGDISALRTKIENNDIAIAGLFNNLNDRDDSLEDDINDIKNEIDNLEVSLMEETTWSELKAKRNSSGLTPGEWYRITDYNTTTSQDNTQAAGHAFDVIVLATDVDKLSEEARACLHSGDTYFSSAGCKLESWKIWYCLDNDINRFAWAESGATGRGVIYRMIDEWNNDCPYDFKNIQFKRYKITACPKSPDLVGLYSVDGISDITVDTSTTYWCYTFSMINNFEDVIDDVSVFQEKYISDENAYYTTHDNIFEPYFDSIYSDEKECSIYINKLPLNVFVTDTDISAIKEDYSYGEFYGFYSNTFGNNCDYNTFGNGFYSNTFGNYCYYNTFGNSCGSNTFGNGCNDNTFGNNCYRNTFGNDCYYNTFGNECQQIRVQKDYVYYIIVENGNKYITITSTQTTSSSNILRNFKISQGVNNGTTESSRKTISHNTVNDTFQTIYANDASGNTVAVNIADIAGVATLLSQI